MTHTNSDLKTQLQKLDSLFEEYLVKKAPSLPEKAKDVIVSFGPYIELLLIIISLPALLAIFGLGAALMPFSFMGGISVGFGYTLGMLYSAATIVLGIIALPGLFKRAKSAWNLLYYSALIGVIYNALTLNIGGLVIGTLLNLYILYQIKEYYK